MAMEIERKFLVHGCPWQELGLQGSKYTQGYLSTDKDRVIRVRLCEVLACAPTASVLSAPSTPHDTAVDDTHTHGYITIKSHISALAAKEYEYAIPAADARLLLDTLAQKPLIEKIRYTLPHNHHVWQIDFFLGLNAGLVMAEIELTSEEESFTKPAWLGEEVSHDLRYKNVHLHTHPFTAW